MARAKILLIDSDPFLTQIYQKQFEKEQWVTLRSLTGEEGIELARKELPDAIVLDMVLPKKTGFEVLEALRSDEATKKIPVIVLTQLSTKEDIDRCLNMGAREYLIKPHHSPEDVYQHLKKFLPTHFEAGFTLTELLCVLGALCLAGFFAWMQFAHFSAERRDAERLGHVHELQATLIAARQERQNIIGCATPGPVSRCVSDVHLLQPDEHRTVVCGIGSSSPCAWTIEASPNQSFSLDHFRVRFFLERDRQNLIGRKTHTIDETGRIE